METESGPICTSASHIRAVHLLQEKWVLFIVGSLLEGPLGFNEISRRSRGVNTTTLSQRMDLLEQHGIVTREVQSTMPPKTSYELTEAGRGLKSVLDAIWTWSEKYLSDAPVSGAPVSEACCPES